jgi:hypothetical protein
LDGSYDGLAELWGGASCNRDLDSHCGYGKDLKKQVLKENSIQVLIEKLMSLSPSFVLCSSITPSRSHGSLRSVAYKLHAMLVTAYVNYTTPKRIGNDAKHVRRRRELGSLAFLSVRLSRTFE